MDELGETLTHLEELIIRLYEVRGQRVSREKWLENFTEDQQATLKDILGWRLTWVRQPR